MHELSIAHSLVETVEDALGDQPDLKVTVVNLQLGVLSGVEEESLRFCFDIATSDTRLAGARLDIEHIAARAFCATCGKDVSPVAPHWYRCPDCGSVCAQLSAGRDLQIASVEVVDAVDPDNAAGPVDKESVQDEAPSA
jgi:hydrogenase nickel incorporation protein HypA/HybF